ncbi:maspardin-like [Colletes gigas]|uniref:maspardin-like n=1 Tax=Colletes gigas TaxID=935657 RepID=UPI001C9A8355|nr:maspardin-like [Colletes gigas]
MSCSSDLSRSDEYLSFRSSIPLRKIAIDVDSMQGWKVYDSSPKTIKCPLICLPPASGTADIFFRQILGLSAKGYRIISVESPVYWDVKEWCDGFRKLLDYMGLDKVHLFGASLGGFLAQKFAEINAHCPRIVSLVLCNTFADTSIFKSNDSAAVFWILPSFMLRQMLMMNFDKKKIDGEIVESINFIAKRMKSLPQLQLASRLTMNCVNCYVQPQMIYHLPVTIIDVFDDYALSNSAREKMYKCYPNAKLAHLKTGGNFPYLSRSAEVNLHLQIHLRQFEGTEYAASERTRVISQNVKG